MAMFPPVFSTLFASSAVKALLGTTPLRVYPAGEAVQSVAKPYATYQTISGLPENYLGTRADADSYTVQLDIYADTLAAVRAVADACRTALEAVAYIVSIREPARDVATGNYRFSLDIDFITSR